MNEIGGYFELETYGSTPYHKNSIALNSGRSCLRYVIRTYEIKEIFAPLYTCPVVWKAIEEEKCNVNYYDIDSYFRPVDEFPKDAYVLYNDWFGVCGDNVLELSAKYPNLIVDNAQSFFAETHGLASFYSMRKFFGLPDGGLLLCNKILDAELAIDVSYDRMYHLLKRRDLGASAGYEAFKASDRSLSDAPIKMMSRLTISLMQNINYGLVRKRRFENYRLLSNSLNDINELELTAEPICPMVYPLLSESETLRQKLIDNKIYVAQYWDGIQQVAPLGSHAEYLRKYLIPLPIDQRYGAPEMQYIIKIIRGIH